MEKINVKYHLKVSNDFYFNDVRYYDKVCLLPEHLREVYIKAVAQFVAVCQKIGLNLLEFEVLIDQEEKIYIIDFENGSLNKMQTPTLQRPFWYPENDNLEYYIQLYQNTLNETTNKL